MTTTTTPPRNPRVDIDIRAIGEVCARHLISQLDAALDRAFDKHEIASKKLNGSSVEGILRPSEEGDFAWDLKTQIQHHFFEILNTSDTLAVIEKQIPRRRSNQAIANSISSQMKHPS